MSRLGRYIVEYRYRVDPLTQPRLRELLAVMRDYTDHLGLASFEVWQQEDDPWTVIELHGYDSWSHYQRVAKQPQSPEMNDIYEGLDRIVEGGLAAVVARHWQPVDLVASKD